jgi:SAM-dependent methyltransferase
VYEALLEYLKRRPKLYEQSTAAFWNDPHVSKGMLKAHLDPSFQGATREHAFVDRSAAWIASKLPSGSHARMLDLGCGPGLYAQRFCAQGFTVTGVDISERSIAYAKKSAKVQNLPIEYRLQNYLELRDREAFDAATLIYCDYGVLKEEHRRLLLSNIYNVLSPGGAFVLDAFMPKEYKNRPETTNIRYCDEGFWSDKPHAFVQSFFRFEKSKTFCDRYIILTESNLSCYHLWNHAFDAQELIGELTDAGFDAVNLFGDVEGATFQKGGRTLCAIAYKPI